MIFSAKEITKKKLVLIEQALEDAILTLSAKLVLIRLLTKHHNNATGRCDPDEETLAADLKISERTVRYAIKQLKECRWLSVQHRFNTSNQYAFNWDCVRSEVQNSPPPVEAKNDTSGRKKRHEWRQISTEVEAKSRHLTIEGTTERTTERTHTESVCDSLKETDINFSGKGSSHGQFNSSLKASPCPSPSARDGTTFSDEEPSNLSPDDTNLLDEDENPFAHLADGEDDFPFHQKKNFLSQQTNNFPSHQENNFSSRPFGYEFSEFWRVFPPEKKFNEKATYRAFVDAVENKAVDARSLAIAANKYKWFCRLNYHQSNHKRYISQPESWLRNERWLDKSRQVHMSNDPERPFIADEPPAPPPPVPQLSLESCGLSEEDLNSIQEEALNKLRSRNSGLEEQIFDDEEEKWAL